MAIKGFTRNIIAYAILTEEQLEEIHRSTLEVLETTGIRFENDKELNIFNHNGCKVDFDDKRVRFPGYIVEESLRRCPSSFLLSPEIQRTISSWEVIPFIFLICQVKEF
jgi:trimethylamine:corrinoid methyltransferase-like protein